MYPHVNIDALERKVNIERHILRVPNKPNSKLRPKRHEKYGHTYILL